MKRNRENPRYHVVSVRVSKEDREAIEELSRRANIKVSDLMREALQSMVPCWQGAPEQMV